MTAGRNRDRVRALDRVRTSPDATCATCGWARSELVGSAWPRVLAAARRHAGRQGHVVLAGVRIATLLGPDDRPFRL